MRRRLVNVITAGALGVAALVTAPAAQAEKLGPVDVHRYCVKNRGAFDGGVSTENMPNKAHSWRCVYTPHSGGVTKVQVNMNQACVQQYGPGAWSRADDRRNPNSWRCYR